MEAAAAKGGSTSELSEPDTPVDGAGAVNADQAPPLVDDDTEKPIPTPLTLTPALGAPNADLRPQPPRGFP